MTDINILNGRAEHLDPSLRRSFDVVTLRAVESFATILPVAATLVAPAGLLALLISAPQLETTRAALPLAVWSAPVPIPLSQSRILLIGHLS